MRITGGEARGRRLRTGRGRSLRPTTDMARKTLFDIIGARVPDAAVLDLFAGTGSLGLEALSRGAARATFVERDRTTCTVLRSNIDALGFTSMTDVRCADADVVLAQGARQACDLVFLDPPYDAGLRFLTRTLQALLEGSWIRPGGTVVVEAPTDQVDWPEGLSEIRTRRFGRTTILIAEHHAGDANSHLSGDV